MRKVIAILAVDDDKAIEEDLGTIDYVQREFGWLQESGIFLDAVKIIDDDDEYDAKAIEFANKIFE
jgi:hypothetical protein